jgi:cytosine/adenosine deaminase-related metal-dependent hydrolase
VRARWIWLGPGTAIGPAELVHRNGRVLEVRRTRGRVPDTAVVPGFVNAHAHLQLAAVEPPQREFSAWVRAVLAQRRDSTPERDAAAARASLAELAASGTTAVGEIDSTGASPAVLRDLGFAGRWYQELTGMHLDARAAKSLVAARAKSGSRACPPGLSPHAPYSVSPALFAAAAAHSRHVQVHVAETPDELEFLRRGRGVFADLLRELGRFPRSFRPFANGPVSWLAQHGLLRRGTVLVHCQHLERDDPAAIAASGAAIAVCPGTIAYFRREPPDAAAWLAARIPVALGTDSRASNDGLDLVRELRRAARWWPSLPPAELLAMATANGGLALGRPALGRLRPRGPADFCAFASDGAPDFETALAQFVHGERELAEVWRRGRRVRPSGAA